MIVSGHLAGGAAVLRRVKIGASFANAGIPTIYATGGRAGVSPATTTSFADTLGLALDAGTYSVTEGAAEGLVTVDLRPDAIIKALMSGGATEGTALTLLVNTTLSAGATLISDGDVGAADMAGGTVWRRLGGDVGGDSRIITTHTGSTSFTVTVPFLGGSIAVNDEFLFCPWALFGDGAADGDGVGNLQTTTLFTQANAAIAAGTGAAVVIFDLELEGRGNSSVLFILQDHQYLQATN